MKSQAIKRRVLLQSGAAAMGLPWLTPLAGASQQTVVFRQDLPLLNTNGYEVTAVEVMFPPGASSARHRHPGFVVGYVLEGDFRFQLDGKPETVLRAGQMFYEPPGAIHAVSASASASKPAKILALIFAPKGEKLVRPA